MPSLRALGFSYLGRGVSLHSCPSKGQPLLLTLDEYRCGECEITKLVVTTRTIQFSAVQSLSRIRLFATLWTAACQTFLSITKSWSLLKVTFIESVMPSNHLILCHPLLPSCSQFFPISGSFPVSQFFTSGDQSIGASAPASVLPGNIQDWFPLGLTGLISFLSKGLLSLLQYHSSKVSNFQSSAFFMVQFSLLYMTTGKTIALTGWTFVGKVPSAF